MTAGAIYEYFRDRVRMPYQKRLVWFAFSVCLIWFVHLSFVSKQEVILSDATPPNGNALAQEPLQRKDSLPNALLLPHRGRNKTDAGDNYQKDVALSLSSNWTSEMTEARRQLMKGRSEESRRRCEFAKMIPGYFETKNTRLMRNLRWVKDYNFVWCPIFKSASTTWAKNLLLLAGEKVLTESFHGRVRELYGQPEDPAEMKKFFESATKLIIVRHPLDRLLSAYRDKMLRVKRACDPYIRIQKELIEKYPDPNGDEMPSSVVTLHKGGNTTSCIKDSLGVDLTQAFDKDPLTHFNYTFVHPTFSQFLLKVKDDLKGFWENKGHAPINMHWRPYWFVCGPCRINYDIIAHVETLGPDQEYIIRDLGLQDILYNSHTHASNFDNFTDTSEAVKYYYSSVSRDLVKDIVKFYKPDFDIFGYSPQPFISLTQ